MRDTSKLPKWAQQEIRTLSQKVNKLEETVLILKSKGTGSGVIQIQQMMENPIVLPDSSNLSFMPKGRMSRIQTSLVDNELRVYAESHLIIRPRGANSCYLTSEEN